MKLYRKLLLGATAGCFFTFVSDLDFDFSIDTAAAQSVLGDGTVVAGHLTVANPPAVIAAPTGTSCTVSAGSTDMAGACAATATSGVAITFAKAFATKPWCVVLDHTTASGNALATEPTTATFVLGTTVSGDKITWICLGVPGN